MQTLKSGEIMRKCVLLLWATIMIISVLPAKAEAVNPYVPYHYGILKRDIKKLQRKYHDVLQLKIIGKSHYGKKLYAVKLGSGERNIIIVGAHHGREWLTSALIMKMIEDYAGIYRKEGEIGSYKSTVLNDVAIWFVPMLNPDGVDIQQGLLEKFPRAMHKNIISMNEDAGDFSRWKANGIGIDLNRQYPAGWEALSELPNAPSFQFYKGRNPAEANEVKALMAFTDAIRPALAVAYHTSGQEIFWEYHNDQHKERDRAIAEKAAMLTGYPLSKPNSDAEGGGYKDWFILKYKKPAMTIEICPLVEETNPPISTFAAEWQRNKYVAIMLANEMVR